MELLRPGMQHGQHAYGSADEAGIAGNIDDGFGRGLHQ